MKAHAARGRQAGEQALSNRRFEGDYNRACAIVDGMFGVWPDLADLAARTKDLLRDPENLYLFESTVMLSGDPCVNLEDEPAYAWAVSETGWEDEYPDAPMRHLQDAEAFAKAVGEVRRRS